MTIAMPDPLPLDMPPGDAEALDELVREVAGVARCLAEIDERLVGAAAAAPGWLGDDAAAAATQVGAVAALVQSTSSTVLSVVGRLTGHADVLQQTRRQVEALRDEQDEQFREAWQRWSRIPDLPVQVMTGGPDVRAVVEELRAGGAGRRRGPPALMEGLSDDAAATARVLVGACAVVGGRGGPGNTDRVIAHLAVEFPGWGDLELARQGRALAGRLTSGTPEERASVAAGAAPLASHSAFANALIAGLGVPGVTYLLEFLDYNGLAPDNPVARLLAAALGAAVPTGRPGDPVARVLDAEYVHRDDRYGSSDDVAAGLATVLAAGLSLPGGGVQTRTVAEWSRQLLLREREQREPVGRRSVDLAPERSDPAALALGILAQRADAVLSAELLADGRVWEAVLRRVWDDGGVALGEVIASAARESGAAGDRAVRTGLSTVGGGLAADDPADWTVDRDTLAAVAPALGVAVAAHVDVAVDALHVGVDGRTGRDQGDVLAGLGYVTLDREAAAVVEQALSGWVQAGPVAPAGTGPGAPLPGAAVLGAYVAVQEYAQRSAHALDALEDREAAENKQWLWEHSAHLVPEILPGYWGVLGGVVEGGLAILSDMDGTWEDRVDRGLVLARTDAAALAVAAARPQDAADVRALSGHAAAAFDRTAAVLGERRVPRSPETDWFAVVEDLGIDVGGERTQARGWVSRPHLPR